MLNNTKETKSSASKKPAQGGGRKAHGKKGGGSGKNPSRKDKFHGNCTYCEIKGHRTSKCFINPNSSSYSKPKSNKTSDGQSKKRKFRSKPSFDEYLKKKKESKQFCLDTGSDNEVDFVEN